MAGDVAMDDAAAIRRRRSVRKYAPESLGAAELDSILAAFRAAPRLDPDIPLRFDLSRDDLVTASILRGVIGSYGRINAPHCLVLSTEDRPGCLENLGYAAQHGVIELARRGWGSCWIGGLFRPDAATRIFRIKAPERPVAVIAFGKPAIGEKSGLLKAGARIKGLRAPASAFSAPSAFGVHGLADMIALLPGLGEAISLTDTSPSSLNARPVRCVLTPGRAAFSYRTNSGSAPLDAGIFMATFMMACRACGVPCRLPDPDEAAAVSTGAPPGCRACGSMRLG